MNIRRYRSEDRPAVFGLHVRVLKQTGAYLGEGPWDDDLTDIEGTYLTNGGEFLVGELDGRTIAMGAFKKSREGFAEVKRMRVDSDHQGRGYGAAILQELERRAHGLGYRGFVLETADRLTVARRLYARHGFKPTESVTIEGLPCTWYEKRFADRSIEEFSVNAWPALQTFLLDGWLLRFANGYTKRSNSVSALYEGSSEPDLTSKIERTERMYRDAGQPVVFKITPFIHPRLDELLEERGYRSIEPSLVMELDDLSAVPEPSGFDIRIDDEISREWTDRLREMNGMSEQDAETTMKLFERPLLHPGFFTLYHGSLPVACGIGVTDGENVGLFDIVTQPEFRGKGCGEQLLRHILGWARERGATRSCLMVLRDNPPANRLYAKLGYKIAYPYGYRMKAE